MASNLIVISPAASVCRTRVLPSDFSTFPDRRSPFLSVIWSARSEPVRKKTRKDTEANDHKRRTRRSMGAILLHKRSKPGWLQDGEQRKVRRQNDSRGCAAERASDEIRPWSQ